jgi:hypothetical protein
VPERDRGFESLSLQAGWGRLLLPGSKPLLHPADMASGPFFPQLNPSYDGSNQRALLSAS